MTGFWKHFFMPWTYTQLHSKISGCLGLAVMVCSFGMMVFDAMMIPFYISLALFVPYLIFMTIKDTIEMRRLKKESETLMATHLIVKGAVQSDDLPPHMQEEIKMSYARWKLNRDDS